MVRKLIVILSLCMFFAGCSGMSYTDPNGARIAYWRTAGMNSDLIKGEVLPNGPLKVEVTGQRSVDTTDVLARILTDALKGAVVAPK